MKSGPYRLQGEDAGGNVLFSLDFDMGSTAHIEGRAFAFTLPVDPSWGSQLAVVTLSGPEGFVAISRSGDRPVALLTDRSTGADRGFLRAHLIQIGVSHGRRLAPESRLQISISQGIPDQSSW